MSDLGWPSTALKRMANGLGWPRSERKPAKVSRETSRSGAVEQAAAAKAAPASPEVELSKTDEESAVEAPQPTPARHKGGGAFRARTAASVNEERRALVQRAVTEPVEPTWSAQPTVAVSDRPAVTTNTASLAGARDGGASSAVGLENDSPALDAQELEHPASAGTAPSDPSLQVIHHIPPTTSEEAPPAISPPQTVVDLRESDDLPPPPVDRFNTGGGVFPPEGYDQGGTPIGIPGQQIVTPDIDKIVAAYVSRAHSENGSLIDMNPAERHGSTPATDRQQQHASAEFHGSRAGAEAPAHQPSAEVRMSASNEPSTSDTEAGYSMSVTRPWLGVEPIVQ